jgi:hypothetical protein
MYLKMHHIDFFMKFLLPRNINLLQLATHYYCLSLEVLRPLKNAILRRIFLRTLWIFQTFRILNMHLVIHEVNSLPFEMGPSATNKKEEALLIKHIQVLSR